MRREAMDVRDASAAYAQMDVAVVPEGYVEIGAITQWFSGGTPSRSVERYWQGDIPWISASTLRKIEVTDSDQCVTSEAVVAGSKMAPINSTLLLVRGSALHNEIRAGIVCRPVCFNQDVKALISSKHLYPRYLTYSILGREDELLKLVSSAGNTAGVLDTKLVQSFKIWLPALEEQRAIATALSDVDALLKALDRLITKKREIKQATMQQLLTGQTRLPGFEGEWSSVRFGDLGKTYGGLTAKTKADFGAGSAFYVPFVNVMKNVVIDCEAFERVRVDPGEPQNPVKQADLLFNGSSETPEEVAMCALMDSEHSNLYLNSFCFGFRLQASAQVSPLFLAYYIRSHEGRELIKSLAQGSTRYNLSKSALLNASITIPSLEEQTSIAAVLADMDTELETLEQRRAKTAALKQAMMQELLTGRTRLVEPQAVAEAEV